MAKKNPEAVTSGAYLPPVSVRVLDGNTIVHDDKAYTGGDVFEVPARTADHLILAGHVEATPNE